VNNAKLNESPTGACIPDVSFLRFFAASFFFNPTFYPLDLATEPKRGAYAIEPLYRTEA